MSRHTETHFVPDPYGVRRNRLCVESALRKSFGSGIRTRYPDHHQHLMEWSLGSWLPSHNISFKSVHNFLSNPANKQTNKQMKAAQRAGTLRNGVAVTDADVVTGYASQRLLWIGIVPTRSVSH